MSSESSNGGVVSGQLVVRLGRGRNMPCARAEVRLIFKEEEKSCEVTDRSNDKQITYELAEHPVN